MAHIYFTVINDLSYDQRMQRICRTLKENGFEITLIGKRTKSSIPVKNEVYHQHRLNCLFTKGKAHYLEFNLRLLFFLLFRKIDIICAIDLDTIVPCYLISRLKKIKRVYDAHELFTEMKEVVTRPGVQKIWKGIGKKYVPRFPNGYTVSQSIADILNDKYGVLYQVIRNMPVYQDNSRSYSGGEDIIYQGAVNEARGFEYLIPAMQQIPARLYIYGDGNFSVQLKELIKKYNVTDKVFLMGLLTPAELRMKTPEYHIGINLVENTGLNQYYSLANKFFDYMHAAVPQITMRYPEYQLINNKYEVAVLIDTLDSENIVAAYRQLCNPDFYNRLRNNCIKAREEYNWQIEENKLIEFYRKIF